jgi:hypothetical protein
MLHPATRLQWIDDSVGFGVIATENIPKGTILWALDPLDRILKPGDVVELDHAGLMPVLEKYSYINGRGERVLCWDHGRFMNHSCDPISLSPGTDFELAVRDIAAGEQITCDYSSLNLEDDMPCLCGSPSCRGVVSSRSFGDLAAEWDRKLQSAVAMASTVPQPLLQWLKDPGLLAGWAANPKSLPSAREHLYPKVPVVAANGRDPLLVGIATGPNLSVL